MPPILEVIINGLFANKLGLLLVVVGIAFFAFYYLKPASIGTLWGKLKAKLPDSIASKVSSGKSNDREEQLIESLAGFARTRNKAGQSAILAAIDSLDAEATVRDCLTVQPVEAAK